MSHRFAIIHDSHRGQTEKVALRIARVLRSLGDEVIVYKLHCLPERFEPEKFDSLIIGAPIHMRRFSHALGKLVEDLKPALSAKPSFFFSVSLSAAEEGSGQAEAQGCIDEFLSRSGWSPSATASFAGALRYRRYHPLLRWIMKRLVRKVGGGTDTSRNYEYTDWEEVEAFGRGCYEQLTSRP
ncbi:MAG: flavodoxin domain-containing protein [Verrucomicrobiales bacterium]